MKFVVNITTGPLAGTLEDDALRGEGRWERLMARALLAIGGKVGTPRDLWAGDSPNWLGHVEDVSDCVYLTIYGGPNQPLAKVYLFQFFSPPDATIEQEMREHAKRVGHRNLFLTYSYPSQAVFDHIALDLKDRVAWLPLPMPDAVQGDATERTVLFHPARGIASDEAGSIGADGGEEVRWVRRALDSNPRLTFEVLGGTGAGVSAEGVWSHPLFAELFTPVRDRVVVHGPLNHDQVQAIYARTRLVTHATWYGGPPVESARYGIPVIARERDNAFYSKHFTPMFPELPQLGKTGTLTSILDRLLRDVLYARRVGDACRRTFAEYYSYAAFRKAMYAILERL